MDYRFYIVGIGITILVSILAFRRILYVKRIDFLVLSLGSIALFHGVFLILSLKTKYFGLLSLKLPDITLYGDYIWIYFIIVMLFSISAFLGGIFPVSQKRYLHKTLNFQVAFKLAIGGWLLLCISIASYWLYSQAYGGFISLWANALYLRAGLLGSGPDVNPWSFLGKLGGLSFVASFAFWAIIMAFPRHKFAFFATSVVGFIISSIFSLYVIYTWFSRSHFIFYVMAFIFSYYVYKDRLRLEKREFFRIVFVILVMFVLFYAISIKTKGIIYAEFIERFKFDTNVRIRPLFVLLDSPEYRWFQDIIYIPIYFLPQRLWRENFVTASDVITIKMMGGRKGEADVTGAMVIGIVPLSFMQCSVIGVVILGLLWGVFLKFIDVWFLTKLPPGFGEIMYAYVAFRFVVSSVWNAGPQVVIYNHIDVIIGMVFMFTILKLRLFRRRYSHASTPSYPQFRPWWS